jgi:molybdenum cofactor guanylyltransferase
MDDRGWHLDRQQGGLHVMLWPYHAKVADEFLADLADAVADHGESPGRRATSTEGSPEDRPMGRPPRARDPSQEERLAGIVLTGGGSRRLGGRDKALVEVAGTPMVTRVATALRAVGAAPVLAVGGNRPALVGLGLLWVPDRWPGEGPLGGLVSALESLDTEEHRWALVCSCDLPNLDAATLDGLLDARGGVGVTDVVDVVAARTDGHLQPLVAAYRVASRVPLARAFAGGTRSLTAALAGLRVRTVTVPDGSAALTDLDTPRTSTVWCSR